MEKDARDLFELSELRRLEVTQYCGELTFLEPTTN